MRSILLSLLVCGVVGAQSAPVYSVETVAGSDWVGDAGQARQALLFQAEGVATDIAGNLYVADAAGHRVRRVSPDGVIRTVAGTGRAGSAGDGGPAVEAQLKSPYGLAVDPTGGFYIADLGNARIRRVDRDGIISTVVGGGAFVAPRNLALDRAGNLYISDFGAHKVFRWTPAGALDVVAGTGVKGLSVETGLAAAAMLAHPAGLAVDRFNALYIADSQNLIVRKVSGGLIQTVAQAGTPTGLAFDAFGTLHIADAGQVLRVSSPALPIPARDVAFGPEGNLYAADGGVVRRRLPNGTVTVFAGGGDPAFGDFGPAVQAKLNHPTAVAADAAGNVYIADRDNHRVRRAAPDGVITTIAGTGLAGDGGDGGPATRASLNTPVALAIDTRGNLYIADQGNHRVRMVTSAGLMLPIAKTIVPSGVAVDDAGRVYIADQGSGRIYRADVGGAVASVISGLASPAGLALDREGNLYFTEAAARRVRKLAPNGVTTTIGAGVWLEPRGVAVSESGKVFIADTGLRQVLRADTLTPVDTRSAIAAPWGIAVGTGGVLYLAAADDDRVQALLPEAVLDPLRSLEVLNAASRAPGPIAPGMLAVIRGRFTVPQVTVGGFAATVLSATADELLIQVPVQVAGFTSAAIEVFEQGVASVPVVAAAPALFTKDGTAIAANEDGSVNSAADPAERGSVLVLYGTGEGVGGSTSVRIGEYDAEILYAGPVDAYPGLFQINVRVPAGYVAAGRLTIVWSVDGASSQPNTSVFIK